MSTLAQDLRHAVRALWRSPAFTAVTVLALALGIGANTAIFSVVNAVLLRPLPFPDADRLVVLYEHERTRGIRDQVAAETFADWREQSTAFGRMAAWSHWGLAITGEGEPEEIGTVRASAAFFDVLGVYPVMGRGFLPEEEQPGRDRVVVISHALWTQRFGADPHIVGRVVALDELPYTIIGVMPQGFRFPDDPAVGMWTPLAYKSFELRTRNQRMFNVLARLAPGRSLAEGRAEMDGIAARLAATYPITNGGWGVDVESAHDVATASSREALMILLGAVGFVLLIACANVGNLMLARATEREREIAVRMALGASRSRLVRQQLAESGIMAALGAAAGLVFAFWGIDLLAALEPGRLPQWNAIRVDRTVLAFTAALALATTVLAGLLPALAATADAMHESLKEGGKSTAGSRRRRLRHVLVISEVALSIVLLVGAGLMLRSLDRVQSQDPGFRPDGLLAATIYLADTRYPEDHRQAEFFATLLERARGLPGVTAAGAVTTLPMSVMGIDHDIPIRVEGVEPVPGDETQADFRIASPGYFEAMGIALLRGRAFAEQDHDRAPRVAVVNRVFVDRWLRGIEPVGRRIRFARSADWIEIVGVVGQVRHRGLDTDPKPEVYVPYRQLQYGAMTFVLRTSHDPLALGAPFKQLVYALDPAQPVAELRTVTDLLHGTLAERRFNTLLLLVFAGVALALAAIGIYGVIAYTVNRRTREIGIRMALGAGARDVVRQVVGMGVRLAGLGTLFGLGGAYIMTRWLGGLLYRVSPTDPLTFLAVALAILTVAVLACVLPARKATRVDPMVALRYD
jgi:putative ABC transport system permease protein